MLLKKSTLGRSLGLCLLLSIAIMGFLGAKTAMQPAPGPAASKVGIVNIQEAIAATNEGKKEFDALQQRFGSRQNALKAKSDEVENMKKDLQARGDKVNEDERASRIKNIAVKQKALQRDGETFQSEVQEAEQEVLSRIGKKTLDVLDKYAKNNGYSVILDVSSPQTPVLWASPDTNITKDLVDAYNANQATKQP